MARTSLGGWVAAKEPAPPRVRFSNSADEEEVESRPIMGTASVSLLLVPVIPTPKWGARVGMRATEADGLVLQLKVRLGRRKRTRPA